MRDGVEHPTSFVEASQKKAKIKELSNNISDRSEAEGTGILSDLLLGERRELSGKSAVYYIIDLFMTFETPITQTACQLSHCWKITLLHTPPQPC